MKPCTNDGYGFLSAATLARQAATPELGITAYETADAARQAGARGWNLRCNRCGGYGARWLFNQRPGWGDLALCEQHAAQLEDENARHHQALATLRAVHYEQDRHV